MINPSLHRELIAEREMHLMRRAEESLRTAEARRDSGRPRGVRALRLSLRNPRPVALTPTDGAVTIRHAGPEDRPALVRLAVLDCAELPPSPLLVAEVDGVTCAALSLVDDRAVANPFRLTDGLVELLRARAAQLRAASGSDDGSPGRARRASLDGLRHRAAADG
jgi:hypothetical protein